MSGPISSPPLDEFCLAKFTEKDKVAQPRKGKYKMQKLFPIIHQQLALELLKISSGVSVQLENTFLTDRQAKLTQFFFKIGL